MINCSEAKKISLISILDKIGAKKVKQTNREIWYISPFRNETTASFKIDLSKNIWFDHGEGKGGNVLDFIMRYFKCDLKKALQLLDNDSFSFHQPIFQIDAIEKEKKYEILKVCNIKHRVLLEYAKNRKIDRAFLQKYCQEIHYRFNSQCFFAIGFKNIEGGYEIRNKYFKGTLGKKSFTYINNSCNKVVLFEGWTDFLSLITLYPSIERKLDFIILNSVSQGDKLFKLDSKYDKIYLCFDNDKAGIKTTLYFERKYSITNRINYLYSNYKDVNDYLCSII